LRPVAVPTASDGISSGGFGGTVAIKNNTLVSGAQDQNPPVEGYAAGEAYVFSLNP
jgi:hypothetical protein